MLSNGIWIPSKFILDDYYSHQLRYVAYFCRIKMAFNRPIIYSYNINKVSDILDVSKSSAYRIINKLIKLKLIVKRNGHFHLISNTKAKVEFHNKKGITSFTAIPKLNSITEIISWLEYSRISISIKGQKGCINKKAHSFKSTTKNIKLSDNRLTESLAINTDIGLSNKKIGEYFGKSIISGYRIQKKLNDLNLIKSTSNIKKCYLVRII